MIIFLLSFSFPGRLLFFRRRFILAMRPPCFKNPAAYYFASDRLVF